MLINIEELNIRKMYLGNEIGTGFTSSILQELQHAKYKNIPKNQIPTHSFILFRKNGNWHVFENHAKWGGVKEMTLKEYEDDRKNDSSRSVVLNEYHFDRQMIEYFLKRNPGYSKLDLGKIAADRLFGLKIPNTPGMVCSETASNCGIKICNVLGIQKELITPCDWMYYFSLKH